MRLSCPAAALAALLGLAATSAVQAYTTTTADKPFNTQSNGNPLLNQGYYYSYGFHDATNDNHATGGNTSGDAPGGVGTSDTRSFYTFDLSGLNLSGQIVTGATLTFTPLNADESGQSTSGQKTEPLQLFQVTTPAATLNSTETDPNVFNKLGSGVAYLTTPFAFPLAPTGSTSLALDSAALADITGSAGGFFSIGAAVQNLPSGAASEEFLFGGSSTTVIRGTQGYGLSNPQALTITTAPRAAAVPEASDLALLGLGGLMLGGSLLGASRRASA